MNTKCECPICLVDPELVDPEDNYLNCKHTKNLKKYNTKKYGTLTLCYVCKRYIQLEEEDEQTK